MNRIFKLVEFEEFDEVNYYAVQEEGNELSETDFFLARFSDQDFGAYVPGYEEALEELVLWIEEIGSRGLRRVKLRFEGEAQALPPQKAFGGSLSFVDSSAKNLRLFCLSFPQGIVVLFGGGIKDAQAVQNCEDLYPHFLLANRLAKKLIEKIVSRELEIIHREFEGDCEIWM